MKLKTNTLLLVIAAFLYSNAVMAQTPVDDLEQGQRSGFSYSIGGFNQDSADLNGGGSYSVSSMNVGIGVVRPVSAKTFMGFGINYAVTNYDFENLAAFAGQQPWDKVRAINFSVPIILLTESQWTFMISPSIGAFQEVEADSGDSLAYGATMIASYGFERGNRIGIGLGVFDRLDETIFYPFLSVKWQLTENLRIGNSLDSGPTGPAGLQLSYRFSEGWELAMGLARRSYRFRLDDTGPAPEGIGTQKGKLAFLRLSIDLTQAMQLDLFAGVIHDGTLILENRDDIGVATVDYESTPLLAVNFNGRF